MTASTLHRQLGARGTPGDYFAFNVGGTIYTDQDIESITIKRGGSGPHPTLTPSTLEITLPGLISAPRNDAVIVSIRNPFLSELAGLGAYTAAQLQKRFTGRVAITSVDDERYTHRHPSRTRMHTTITATSWTTVIRGASRRVIPQAGQNIGALLVEAASHPTSIEKFLPVDMSTATSFDRVAVKEDPATFAEITRKYADDLHTLSQHRRDGLLRFKSINARRDELVRYASNVWPILRTAALSPAKWQGRGEAATEQLICLRNVQGTAQPYTQSWPISESQQVVPLVEREIDIRHSDCSTESFRHIMNALNNATNYNRTGVQSVTLDLGRLYRSEKPAHRSLLHMLLGLEEGEPVWLAGDWPPVAQGAYTADGITETITPDSWRMQLDLSRAYYSLGFFDSELPLPNPRVWDADVRPWQDAADTWSQL